jgi:ketosteroid isomerase-like protein
MKEMEDEKERIDKLRLIVQEAENTGNLAMMAAILAEDLTVIAPGAPVINTKAGGVDFLKSWFDAFKIEIRYTSENIVVKEDLAYEWAIYHQTTTDKTTGPKASEVGRILWIYKKCDEQWLQHFIIWNTEN